nr:MAG: RNA dependent RNA polymerase [Leviviridae sp.]
MAISPGVCAMAGCLPPVGGDMKSHEQSLISICGLVLKDIGYKDATEKRSLRRDFKTIVSRTKHEGLSFLTITLPSFSQDLERALEEGKVVSPMFPSFKKHGALPAFLRGLTTRVFCAATGNLLDEPSIDAISDMRQLCSMFKKVSIACTPEREKKALDKFKETEASFHCSMRQPVNLETFRKVSTMIWPKVLGEVDFTELIPKHGPGQTAERITGNQKYAHRVWYERLNTFLPLDENILVNLNEVCPSDPPEFWRCPPLLTYVDAKGKIPLDKRYVKLLTLSETRSGMDTCTVVQEGDELPVRVTCVPKTLKGPRIIAIEPVCMQYAQQALSAYVYERIENSELTGGHINFTDQTINQNLAIKASSDGMMSTLDMSDASDRVPASLVSHMLDCVPKFRDAVFACRSSVAQMPDGELILLSKFASMGSAMCFPIEAMYFYTVILTSMLEKRKLPVTYENVYKMSRMVYVYGDDIIIPVGEVAAATEALTDYHCKVNTAKSFWNGKFRESCGMDAYDGEKVTPIYLRQMCPSDRGATSSILSWIATSNLPFMRGYWHAADYMKFKVESIIGKLPIIQETSAGVGWLHYSNVCSVNRWDKLLHRYLVKTYVAVPRTRRDVLEGWPALLKCLLSMERSYTADQAKDRKHLVSSPGTDEPRLNSRWVQPF